MNTEYKILPAPRKKGTEEKISKVWADAQNDGYDLTMLLTGETPSAHKGVQGQYFGVGSFLPHFLYVR